MKLFELLEKVYNRNLEDLPRRIKYRGTIYVINPYVNYTYYKEGESHTHTMEIDTCFLRDNIEILEDNTESLKAEISKLCNRVEELTDQLDNVKEALNDLD